MKLISKTILYYLLISLPLLLVACLFSFYLIKSELRDGTDELLWKEKTNVEKLINSSKTPEKLLPDLEGFFRVQVVPTHAVNYAYTDTTFFEAGESEAINFRVLKSFYSHNQTTYLITILKPTLEENELMEGLLSSLFLVILFLVLSFFFVNWILSKWIWKPFHSIISLLNNYELKNKKQLKFKSSSIKEFDQLSESLNKMTDKIYSDFLLQKEFTENASHEMQTPLAVIKTRLELLIQSENLKEDEMNQLQVIENSINKLASLNKALLLLVKIENEQFKKIERISLKNTLQKCLIQYQELLKAKNIQVNTYYNNDIFAEINYMLCDILISNLIQNAIRHNIENGIIKIELINRTLLISNTGGLLKIKPEELFERFKKNDSSQESIGIGLAIVKSITDHYNIQIKYETADHQHLFRLNFPE